MDEICNSARKAYELAISSGHTEELQEESCKDSGWAYFYAMDVEGADIGYCQEMACKDPYWAYYFAMDVKGSDIDYCQEMACKDPYWAYYFAKNVKGAGLKICLDAVKDTEWEDKLRELVVEKYLE